MVAPKSVQVEGTPDPVAIVFGRKNVCVDTSWSVMQGNDGLVITRSNDRLPGQPFASVTVAVTWKRPACVGVPESLEVESSNVIPAGNVPLWVKV